MQIFYLYHNTGNGFDEYALYEYREDAERHMIGNPLSEVISLVLVTRPDESR